MSIAFLNGSFLPLEEARISPLDRGFLFADGVYEVIPYYSGEPFGLEGHLIRLQRSLEAVRIPLSTTTAEWEALLQQLVVKNGGGDLSVYLQITRGAYETRNHAFPDEISPTIFAMVSPITPPLAADATKAKGITAMTIPDTRWSRCDIKSIALLPNILLKQQAADSGAQEAILVRDGHITECAAANVFAVKNGTIYTPIKDDHILGGITRDIIIGLAQDHHMPLQEIAMTQEFLEQADEVWISSSTREILPVVELNSRPVGNGEPGALWQLMAEHYQANKKRVFREANV
ncbi:D-amino acid aminotransferase [Alkalimarinus sediminis]|uniref:Aminodeoxychorismate lyase n=1 Tax=Alkalimarinus sediminis TaxID=1632866 RepID=A0A9E8KID2_9ALTE|nr:D-amino acid aminotransferase [Alkalimarinus sediminis]UZW73806.1 D-amino acid aminotransferase [Alkalimarinus sediminis]